MRSSINRQMGPAEWTLLIVLSILWGGSFFLGKIALAELHPLTLVLGRVAIAALALNLVVKLTGQRMPTSWRQWGPFFLMGAINNLIPFTLIFWAQTQISSGLAAILNATTPLWTVLLAHLFTTDERLSANRLGGVLAGVLGVTFIIGPEALQGMGLNVVAQIAVVGAALSYALAGIYGRRFSDTPPLVTAAGQVTGTTIMMVPIVVLVAPPWTRPLPSLGTWGALLGLALLCTALAYIIYFRLLRSTGATNLLLVSFLIPISSLILGMTFLGERIEPQHLAGMGLIGVGLAAIDGRVLTWLRNKRAGHRAASPQATDNWPSSHRKGEV